MCLDSRRSCSQHDCSSSSRAYCQHQAELNTSAQHGGTALDDAHDTIVHIQQRHSWLPTAASRRAPPPHRRAITSPASATMRHARYNTARVTRDTVARVHSPPPSTVPVYGRFPSAGHPPPGRYGTAVALADVIPTDYFGPLVRAFTRPQADGVLGLSAGDVPHGAIVCGGSPRASGQGHTHVGKSLPCSPGELRRRRG
jgi:hypothetical protein